MGKCHNQEKCKKIREKRKEKQTYFCQKWQSKFESFFDDCKNNKAKIILDQHFNKRSYERVINEKDLISVLEYGDVIEQSKNGGGIVRIVVFSYLKKGAATYRPIHVVLEVINDQLWSVITSYSPESHAWKWSETYDEKICFCKGGGI